MGLDLVELVIAVEEAFQIHIEDSEAEKTATVGALYELILGKLAQPRTQQCLTSSVFYRVRRALADQLDIPHKQIVPKTPLRELFPWHSRRRRLHHLGQALDVKTPSLEVRKSVLVGLLLLSIAITVHGCGFAGWWRLPLFPVVLLSVLFGGLVALWPLHNAFPANCDTVGDLSKAILALNHAKFGDARKMANDGEVWESLCRIIVDQLGVEREDVRPEASFVDDLRAN